jgi:hypothetical protein
MNATRLENLPHSGYVLLDIELLAPGTLTTNDALATRLTDPDSFLITFRLADAVRSLDVLDAADFSDEAIQQFLIDDERDPETIDAIEAINGSLVVLRRWLETVSESDTGVLLIG